LKNKKERLRVVNSEMNKGIIPKNNKRNKVRVFWTFHTKYVGFSTFPSIYEGKVFSVGPNEFFLSLVILIEFQTMESASFLQLSLLLTIFSLKQTHTT